MLKFKNLFCAKEILNNNLSILNIFGFCKKTVAVNLNSFRGLHSSGQFNRKKGIIYPNGYSLDWAIKAFIPNIGIYTHEPLPKVKTGGRGPQGRVELKCISGGLNRPQFMVSTYRGGIHNGTEEVITEKILQIHKNFWRPEFIALVARGTKKRWILATTSMKVGDLINSYSHSSKLIVRPNPGDAWPVGCLSVGLAVCQIERFPGSGAIYCINAGTQGSIVQKLADNSCIIKLTDKLIRISSGCSVVVGQISNLEHKAKRFTRFGQKRWLGIKQRSGLRQRKTGRFGRKIHKPKPPVDYTLTTEDTSNKSVFYTKREYPAAIKKPGTFDNPVHIKPFPVEEGQLHPRYKWCSWSRVR